MESPINDLRYFPHIVKCNDDEVISEFKNIEELDVLPIKNHFCLDDDELWNNIAFLFNTGDVCVFLRFRPKLSTQNSERFNIGFKFTGHRMRWFNMNGMNAAE